MDGDVSRGQSVLKRLRLVFKQSLG